MATTGFRTIVIQGDSQNVLEKLAGEANIKPGHLLAISSGAVIKHATADGVSQRLVAVESPTASGTGLTIDKTYANGDTVYYTQARSGDVLYMILADSNVAVGGVTPLVSNGDGTLKIATVAAGTLEDAVVGYAEESVTTSGAVARIRVRIR